MNERHDPPLYCSPTTGHPERLRPGLPRHLREARLRARPQALAHFLLAVPDEVLERCGVILARMAADGAG